MTFLFALHISISNWQFAILLRDARRSSCLFIGRLCFFFFLCHRYLHKFACVRTDGSRRFVTIGNFYYIARRCRRRGRLSRNKNSSVQLESSFARRYWKIEKEIRDAWPRRPHVLAPLVGTDRGQIGADSTTFVVFALRRDVADDIEKKRKKNWKQNTSSNKYIVDRKMQSGRQGGSCDDRSERLFQPFYFILILQFRRSLRPSAAYHWHFIIRWIEWFCPIKCRWLPFVFRAFEITRVSAFVDANVGPCDGEMATEWRIATAD